MPPSLEAQTLTHLLEGRFHLPASNEPADDPLWLCAESSVHKEARVWNSSFGISDQDPTQRYGRQPRAVPDSPSPKPTSTVRSSLPYQSETVIDFQTVDRVFSHRREVGQTLTLESVFSIRPGYRGRAGL